MVGVKMGDQEVVELFQPRDLGSDLVDTPGIAVVPAPAGVYEQRLAGRRHDQRRPAALDIDPVDVQRARHAASLRGEHHRREGHQRQRRRDARSNRARHRLLNSTVSSFPFSIAMPMIISSRSAVPLLTIECGWSGRIGTPSPLRIVAVSPPTVTSPLPLRT